MDDVEKLDNFLGGGLIGDLIDNSEGQLNESKDEAAGDQDAGWGGAPSYDDAGWGAPSYDWGPQTTTTPRADLKEPQTITTLSALDEVLKAAKVHITNKIEYKPSMDDVEKLDNFLGGGLIGDLIDNSEGQLNESKDDAVGDQVAERGGAYDWEPQTNTTLSALDELLKPGMDEVENVEKWIDAGFSGDMIDHPEGSNWHFIPRDPTKDLQYVLGPKLLNPLLKQLFAHLSAARETLTPTVVAELRAAIAIIVPSATSWLEKNDPVLLEALRSGPTLDYVLRQLERAMADTTMEPLVDALRAETGVDNPPQRAMQGRTRLRKSSSL